MKGYADPTKKGGFLKNFLDKSVVFDIFVLVVLALDAYLLQRSGTFSSSGITEFPASSIEIWAAQLTVLLIGLKIINAIVDTSDH